MDYGIVVTGVLTGFAATGFTNAVDFYWKHRQWRSDIKEKERAAARLALSAYLTGRPTLGAVAPRGTSVPTDFESVQEAVRRAGYALVVVLPQEADARVVLKDMDAVNAWLARAEELGRRHRYEDIPPPPDATDVTRLAMRLGTAVR